MNHGLEKRRRLFNIYAANLRHFNQQYLDHDLFVCPICYAAYTVGSVEEATLGVNLAHVWPESVGGWMTTLTCAQCNTAQGVTCDHEIAKQWKLWRSVGDHDQNTDWLKSKVTLDGHTIAANLRKTGDGTLHIAYVPKASNPVAIVKFREALEAGKHDLNFKHKQVDRIAFRVAILHSAYLRLFKMFSYEYVAYANVDWIRDTLKSGSFPEGFDLVTVNLSQITFEGDITHKVFFARRRGDNASCLAVALPAPNPKNPVGLVLMPGFGDEGHEQFVKIMNSTAGQQSFEMFTTEFEDHDVRLANNWANGMTFGRWMWQEVTSGRFSDQSIAATYEGPPDTRVPGRPDETQQQGNSTR